MTPETLLLFLQERGVTLCREGDVLRYRCQKGALPDEIKEAIRQHRQALLGLFQSVDNTAAPPATPHDDATLIDAITDLAEERAAILEYDAGMTREKAERKAAVITVRWARERGYINVTNPITGEIASLVAKGAPGWLMSRLPEKKGK